MKFLHVSDLHLGKRLHGGDLYADHAAILTQILELATNCDAILIAGDIYNRARPQPNVITQFSRFLSALAALEKPVFIVRGNHDGEAQIAYAADLLANSRIYISEVFSGRMQRFVLKDALGPLHIWLLPFIKPAQVRSFFPNASIVSYADAVQTVIDASEIDLNVRNVLVTHQFVSGAQISNSEEHAVGGLEQIPVNVFAPFDYVALGHLHRPQTLASGQIRYSGAPLIYSFDECGQKRSATIVHIGAKGTQNQFEFHTFQPLHPCIQHTGTLSELAALPRTEDYVQITLTDEIRPLDPLGALRPTYPNLRSLQIRNSKTNEEFHEFALDYQQLRAPIEHFAEFYAYQNNGQSPSSQQLAIIEEIIQEGGIEI